VNIRQHGQIRSPKPGLNQIYTSWFLRLGVLKGNLKRIYSFLGCVTRPPSAFCDKIVEAERGAIKSAVAIMGYFTRTASQLGVAGKTLRRTTPGGLQVAQPYSHKDAQRFQSINLGRFKVTTLSGRIGSCKARSTLYPVGGINAPQGLRYAS